MTITVEQVQTAREIAWKLAKPTFFAIMSAKIGGIISAEQSQDYLFQLGHDTMMEVFRFMGFNV